MICLLRIHAPNTACPCQQVVQRSDAARWLILYKYGGVYIDNGADGRGRQRPRPAVLQLGLRCSWPDASTLPDHLCDLSFP